MQTGFDKDPNPIQPPPADLPPAQPTQNDKARMENDDQRKERVKEKCAFFWQQAEGLFHDSFNRIREERKHKATKKEGP